MGLATSLAFLAGILLFLALLLPYGIAQIFAAVAGGAAVRQDTHCAPPS